jgi:uncharacterized protein YlxW (UPF0749 family)
MFLWRAKPAKKKRYPIITVIPKVPSQIYLFGQFILCSSLFYILVKLIGENSMRKQVVAFLFAFIITAIVALSMLVVGVNAAKNPNGVAASNSPSSATANISTNTDSSQAQIAQLQSLVAQYQAREQQYQTALNSDNQQLSQAAQEIQMIQQLLTYLQNHGLIQIDNQGQISVTAN